MCDLCNHTGYRTVEVPVFCDGGWSDVEQATDRCCCNAAPTDEDYLAAHPWHDDRAGWPGETEYPADPVLPVVDFDRRAA